MKKKRSTNSGRKKRWIPISTAKALRALRIAERQYRTKRVGSTPGFSWGAFAGVELVKVTKGPKKGKTVLCIHEVVVFSKADARALALSKGVKFVPHISKAVEGERFGGDR